MSVNWFATPEMGAKATSMRSSQPKIASELFRLSIGVCLMGGFVTSAVSLLVPSLKLMLDLSYAQALLVQLAFHSSYLLLAVPITGVIVWIGYMRAIAAGLAIMALGCLALVVAQQTSAFAAMLCGLLILSAGLTFLQIASNTSIALVAEPNAATANLTLLQGFNSLGTVLAPTIAAPLLLSGSRSGAALPFLASAAALTILAVTFIARRDLLVRVAPQRTLSGSAGFSALLRQPRLRFGAAAIFAYVGAEVAIGTLLTNYLMLSDVLAASPIDAGRAVGLYWTGAMVGRFAGGLALRRASAARMLASAAFAAAVLSLAATILTGAAGAAALLCVGLVNSIMYPTIFGLALPRDEQDAPLGSMVLCMAVVGGAVVPVATGLLADAAGLAIAFSLPALCYVVVAWFGCSCLREPHTLGSRT